MPITFVSLEPAPGDNGTSPLTSGCGPSAPARDFIAPTPAGGYGNAGFKGPVPQPGLGAMPSTSQRYGSAAPWTSAAGVPQYGPYATSARSAYGYPPYRDSGAVAAQYRRDAYSPTGYNGAFGNPSRASDAYNRFPGTPRDISSRPATGYSPYGQLDGKASMRPTPGNPPYDGRPGPVDIDMERCPGNNGSPTQYNVSVRGMPRRSMAARRMSCGAPTSRSRRSMSPSPPPRDRSASPVPRVDIEPTVGSGPGSTSKRSVGSSRSRGRTADRVRDQELAREALDEAQDILATVREQMDTRDDFRQRMGARDLERFKAAVKQLERALDVQKSQPLRRCKSPRVQ